MSGTNSSNGGTGDGTPPTNTATGGDAGTGQQQDGSTGQAPAPTGQQQDTGTQATGGTGQQTSGDGTDDLAALSQTDLARMVKDLRKENASARTNAKQQAAEEAKQQLAQDIGKALGLVNDDQGAPDPEQLAQQLTEERRERYAEKAARSAGLDVDALLDSRSFAKKLDGLDPASDTFTSDLESLITSYQDNPKYKATGQAPAPPRSSADFSGGSGDKSSDLGSLPMDEYIQQTRKKGS